MKKSLLVWLALILWATLSGCKFFQIMDWDWMEREVKYPKAEQECIDNGGTLDWERCFFNCETYCPDPCDVVCWVCYLEDIEKWKCPWLYGLEEWINEWWEWITVATDMCNEQWGSIEQWHVSWHMQDVCIFDDKTYCYLEDLAAWNCEKWDISYINNWYIYAE